MSITIDTLISVAQEWDKQAKKWDDLANSAKIDLSENNIDKIDNLNEYYIKKIDRNNVIDVDIDIKKERVSLVIKYWITRRKECEFKARKGREIVEKIQKNDSDIIKELKELNNILDRCSNSNYTPEICARLKKLIEEFTLAENKTVNYEEHLKRCSSLPTWPYQA